MSVRTRTAVTGTLAAGLGVAFASIGTPATAAPSTASTSVAYIRSAHLSPTTPGVDVYLTSFAGKRSHLWVSGEAYGGVSKYVATAPGLYTVSMRPHGASPSTPATLSWTLDAKAGDAYTAAAVGSGSDRRGTVLDDDLSLPKAGTARVRLIQAASNAPQATVVAVDGPVVAKDARFATATGYAQIAAGTWPLEAASVEKPGLLVRGRVSVPSGSVTSIVLLDKRGGGLRLKTVPDAAAAVTMPKGAVHAGGGGTATHFTGSTGDGLTTERVVAGSAGVLILTGFAVAYGARRRRPGQRPAV